MHNGKNFLYRSHLEASHLFWMECILPLYIAYEKCRLINYSTAEKYFICQFFNIELWYLKLVLGMDFLKYPLSNVTTKPIFNNVVAKNPYVSKLLFLQSSCSKPDYRDPNLSSPFQIDIRFWKSKSNKNWNFGPFNMENGKNGHLSE